MIAAGLAPLAAALAPITGALPLITYVWHYLVARMLFDQLVAPLERGQGPRLLMLACMVAIGFLVGRSTSRRRR